REFCGFKRLLIRIGLIQRISLHNIPYRALYKFVNYNNLDGIVKSPFSLSFRVKREILVSTTGEILLQPIEKIRFLPAVEMTHSMNSFFYEFIKIRIAGVFIVIE
ncbi:MAG: hypothetical protein KKB05_09690, partial [Proteobacteria bacterium]|nr:hypothetical protein [Pseudomonadota bacterium]